MKPDWCLTSEDVLASGNVEQIGYDESNGIEEVDQPDHAQEVKVVPNPNSGKFRLTGEGIQRYDIFDMYGKLIQSSPYGGQETGVIDLSLHGKGVYIVRILQRDNMVSKKIVYQ